jgi:hypothetical protein
MKTAYLIGGYARSGKTTMMSLIKQMGGNTFSTSKTLAEYAKTLFPDLIGLVDCTTDSAKAMTWDFNLIELSAAWVQDTLMAHGYQTDRTRCEIIVDDFYRRLGAAERVTLRQLMIAAAESHRIIFPNLFAELMLDKIGTLDTVYLETIGGRELDALVKELRSMQYRLVGVNNRSKTEQAGVDIRELIRPDQCNYLMAYHNTMVSKADTLAWVNANILK